MALDLNAGEKVLGKLTIFYIPPGGRGKYNGKLTVTDQRLLYDAKYDFSVLGLHEPGIYGIVDTEGGLQINKNDIATVDVEKRLLSKKAILTLSDGSKHTFDYGALPIDKCVAAIQAR